MPKNDAELVVERRNESRKWFKENFYDELTEVFRAIKCKTKPIMERDSAGNETGVEDKSRTNVCMPDSSLIFRRNTARMTAQPYRLKYTGSADPRITESLSALAIQQYNRSREAYHDRRIVMMGEAFGFGYGKLYWDTLARTMNFRKALLKGNDIVYRDRASVMRSQGAPEEEIQQAVQELGPELQDKEISSFIGRSGSEITVPQEIKKYEGPCVKSVFIGELHLPPGAMSLDDADFVIEEYQESDLWLKKMSKLQYRDESGNLVPVFDAKSCKDLLDIDTGTDDKTDDLKQYFEASIGKQSSDNYQFPSRLRARKKYDILEQHSLEDDGRIWITYVAEKMPGQILGKMPYPVDMYGKYAYTEFVPLPDMISAYGDSTPRLLRHLQAMHNLTVAQNFDYVTDVLKRFILKQTGTKIEGVVERGRYRELQVSDLNGIRIENLPSLPPGALERESQILRMIALGEPVVNTVDSGTANNPMAGKLATTAILNAKAADALTQFKIDGRNLYLRELGQKKLWMNQQMADGPWRIESDFYTADLKKMVDGISPQEPPEWALSDRNGKTVAIRLDPLEIQEDIEVEPEAGSYLSVDDELRQAAAADLARAAQNAPGIIDSRKVARFYLGTIRGIGNPDDYMMPEQTEAPAPEVKVSMSVTAKWGELDPSTQAQVLARGGIQVNPAEVETAQQLHGVKQIAEAADAAAKLTEPAGDVEPNVRNLPGTKSE